MPRKKGRRVVNAKKCNYNGITFQSKLEMYCFKALEREGIPFSYEKRSIELLEDFVDPAPFYKSHGKAEVKEKTNKVRGITYKPDFEDDLNNPHYGFFIETKGRANESYPMRVKLFRWWRKRTGCNKDFFEPKNENEVEQVIQIIKQNL